MDSMKYILTVTNADLELIGACLGVRPFNEVAELLNRMAAQLAAQEEEREEGDSK
jgi:hypothetical protein